MTGAEYTRVRNSSRAPDAAMKAPEPDGPLYASAPPAFNPAASAPPVGYEPPVLGSVVMAEALPEASHTNQNPIQQQPQQPAARIRPSHLNTAPGLSLSARIQQDAMKPLYFNLVAALVATAALVAMFDVAALHRCSPLGGCKGEFLSAMSADDCNSVGSINATNTHCGCKLGWDGRFCEQCADHYTAPECAAIFRGDPSAVCSGKPYTLRGCSAPMPTVAGGKSSSQEDTNWLFKIISPWALLVILVVILLVLLIALCFCC